MGRADGDYEPETDAADEKIARVDSKATEADDLESQYKVAKDETIPESKKRR